MIDCKIYGEKFKIYNCSNFPYFAFYEEEKNNFLLKGKKNKKIKIYETIISFDTESSTITFDNKNKKKKDIKKDYAFTYIWGFKIGQYIVVGRYMQELTIFLRRISDLFEFNKNDKMIIFVHNLSYDFQFIYQFLKRDFEDMKIFATDKRKILYFNVANFEFRCSYKLTNMSLDRWGKKEKGVKYNKLSGQMDYKKIIYPDETLKRNDFRYFVGDLITLWDCIYNKLKNDEKNYKNLPLTSTGYVREFTKEKTIKDYRYRYYLSRMTLNLSTYKMLSYVKIGGDTHTNRFYQGRIIDIPTESRDIKSSYPYAECTGSVPVSNFIQYGKIKSLSQLDSVCSDFCTMFYIFFKEIEIKPYNPLSVISISKILNNNKIASPRAEIEITDNGRLIKGKNIILALTDVRWEHIKKYYNFRGVKVWNLLIAERGLIPHAYRQCVFDMFLEKCKLEKYKGTEKEFLYEKFKNLLNATYGMCVTDIIHPEIILEDIKEDEDPWQSIMTISEEKQIEKYNKKWDRHLFYPWGIWIVDNARSNLYELIECCDYPLYWDTDSCKGYGWNEKKLKAYNEKRINRLKELGFNPYVDGKYYPFGGAELDGEYKKFISLGAKKYCYEDGDGLHTTIAGVSKKGSEALKSIEDFKVGFIFGAEYAGQCAKYNDDDFHYLTTRKNHKFVTASNIALVDSEYTLNASDDYLARDTFTILERIN